MTYVESPFELPDGRILLLRTDRDLPGFILYDAEILAKPTKKMSKKSIQDFIQKKEIEYGYRKGTK